MAPAQEQARRKFLRRRAMLRQMWQPIAWRMPPTYLHWHQKQLLATYGPREAGRLTLIIRTLQHPPFATRLRRGRQGPPTSSAVQVNLGPRPLITSGVL